MAASIAADSILTPPPDCSTPEPAKLDAAQPSSFSTISPSPSDEDRSSEEGSLRSGSARRELSHSSSISDFEADEENVEPDQPAEEDSQAAEVASEPLVGDRASSSKPRSRSSTIRDGQSDRGDGIQRLTAVEIQKLTSSPDSLPVAPAPPQRRSLDQQLASNTLDQREVIRQSVLLHPELSRASPFRSPPVAEASPGLGIYPTRDYFPPRGSPSLRTVSTPPTSRMNSWDSQYPVPSSPRRNSVNPISRPLRSSVDVDGTSEVLNGNALLPKAHTRPSGITVPSQSQDINSARYRVASPLPSPMPQAIPLPPMSLPTHLQLELAAQKPSPLYIHQTHNDDLPYESSAVKFERLKNVLLLPPFLERTLYFGAMACLDAWLYNFTILPVRFTLASAVLMKWWVYIIAKEAKWMIGFVWDGLGRVWHRAWNRPTPACVQKIDAERERTKNTASGGTAETTAAATSSASATARRTSASRSRKETRPSGTQTPRPSFQTTRSTDPRRGTFRHRRTKSMPSSLSSFHKADLLQGALIICSSIALMSLDASRMYHFIRAQSAIKLYVIYNILEVGDRLLSAIGQDILECLFSSETLSRNPSGRSKILLPLGMFCLALGYNCLHSIALYYQVITLNVAVNSYSNALLTLLLSNQFVEVKSTVFKRFEKDNLFQLTCADIVERFQLWIMLLIIGMRNVVEVGGLSIPGAGLDDGLGDASTSAGLRNSSVLPHSFTVLPSWLQSGEVLSPFLIVIGSEMLVDSIKHAYVTKFNNIKPKFYSRILDILCKDYYTNAFTTPSLTRRLGLAVIPLSCLFIRASIQTYHMFLSTQISMPMPQSTQTSLSEESATPSSPAVLAALNRFDSLLRDSLGRATYGYPYGSPLNSRPWYAWTSDDYIAAVTMVVFFFIAFLVLLILKLLLGMILLKYSRERYTEMKSKEALVAAGKAERDVYECVGRRSGGFGHIEVGEERQRWIHVDQTEGLKGGKGPSWTRRQRQEEKKATGDGDYNGVSRYEMVTKRIW